MLLLIAAVLFHSECWPLLDFWLTLYIKNQQLYLLQ